MTRYVCMIQEGQAADREREALAAGLRQIGAECFGEDLCDDGVGALTDVCGALVQRQGAVS